MELDDVRNLSQKLSNAIAGVVGRIHMYSNINYWRLYLDGGLLEREVDTCATSQVTSILCHALLNYSNEAYKSCFDMICKSLFTVVCLRNDDGAWPSVIDADELMMRRNSGDNAIGDTYFALTALCDAGFLDDEFQFSLYLSDDLHDIDNRIKFVERSINWLIDNKARRGQGWYYTDNEDERTYSATLTTINIIYVFSKILSTIKKSSKANQHKELIQILEKQVNEGVDNLIENTIQSITERSIGSRLNYDNQESLIHTCKLFNLLVALPTYDQDIVQQLFSYIAANITNAFDERLQISESWLNENYGFERYSIHKFNSYHDPLPPVEIDHENYMEGIFVATLINAKRYGFNVNKESFDIAFAALIARCKSLISKKPPLFACHSKRDGHNRNCPVYASYEAYMALEMYEESYSLFIEGNNELDVTTPAGQFIKTILKQINKLNEYITARPERRDVVVNYIARLNGMLSAVNNESLEKMKKEYSEIGALIRHICGTEYEVYL